MLIWNEWLQREIIPAILSIARIEINLVSSNQYVLVTFVVAEAKY